MATETVREARRRLDFSRQLLEKGWYHSFELPDGSAVDGYMSVACERERYGRFPIPPDLRGKRVLDIGAWDGWFSFEAERHGAAVTAIDCVELPHFLEIHRRLGSRVDYRILDFYELPGAGLGTFDIVFFLGVLYHLKHPLLALEIVCALTQDIALVDSFVTDGDTWQDHAGELPSLEFYETDELAGQLDNWFGPGVACLLAMCRAAGFARVELLHAKGHNAVAACYRRWEPPPAAPSRPAPELITATHNRNHGINFSTRREEYLSAWFRAPEPVDRAALRLEVDGLGVPALFVKPQEAGTWEAGFRLPPGLAPGWRTVRLRFAGSAFGLAARIAVDMPLAVERLEVKTVCDSFSWRRGEVRAGGYASCWAAGLPENCDVNNTRAYLGATRLRVAFLGEADENGARQINVAVPQDTPRGAQPFRLECGSAASEPVPLEVL